LLALTSLERISSLSLQTFIPNHPFVLAPNLAIAVPFGSCCHFASAALYFRCSGNVLGLAPETA
jgi:hypothetical protein